MVVKFCRVQFEIGMRTSSATSTRSNFSPDIPVGKSTLHGEVSNVVILLKAASRTFQREWQEGVQRDHRHRRQRVLHYRPDFLVLVNQSS